MLIDNELAFLARLAEIVGKRNLLTKAGQTRRFSRGYRFGSGPVLAVACPGTLLEQYRAFEAAVRYGAIVIVQAANTGLTGGSTPQGTYDRPVVIINTLRISQIYLLSGGQQAVCLAGATLYDLERLLAPIERDPHSIIGSSCIGASVVGGICNNSGGALVRRGPAYTELALFACASKSGEVKLVNHLGIVLDGTDEEVLNAVQRGKFRDDGILQGIGAASSPDYESRVRDIDAATPARYNSDPTRLYEAAGSAGKVMVLAVRVDTFPKDNMTGTFYVGTNSVKELTDLRRKILAQCSELPISGEYIHREAFDIAKKYGKDLFLAIDLLGTRWLPKLFAFKHRLDAITASFPSLSGSLSDHLMQSVARMLPEHLPARIREWRDRFEHHLIIKVSGTAIKQMRATLHDQFANSTGDYFECTAIEARKAFLHRFAVAGAAVRYREIHRRDVGDIIALDVALRRNDPDWFERLPTELGADIVTSLYYGHFFCHVFHQDYIVRKGVDAIALEHLMCSDLDRRGAEYPAEHNVGHLYRAKQTLRDHYHSLDPGNHLNPGIGQTSRRRNWGENLDEIHRAPDRSRE